MNKISVLCVLTLAAILIPCQGTVWMEYPLPRNVYSMNAVDYYGRRITFDRYMGDVIVFINIPPVTCPYSSMFLARLNHLHNKYYMQGLRILAFPCGEFGCEGPKTFPPSEKWIRKLKFNFKVFRQVEVNGFFTGNNLWSYLRTVTGNFFFTKDVVANFEKFVTDRQGVVVERLPAESTSRDLENAILRYL